jgi:hypothetical protein
VTLTTARARRLLNHRRSPSPSLKQRKPSLLRRWQPAAASGLPGTIECYVFSVGNFNPFNPPRPSVSARQGSARSGRGESDQAAPAGVFAHDGGQGADDDDDDAAAANENANEVKLRSAAAENAAYAGGMAAVADDTGDHGALMRKIQERKAAATAEAQSGADNGAAAASEAAAAEAAATARREREAAETEVDTLRAAIQLLTRSANPLGAQWCILLIGLFFFLLFFK